MTTTHPKQHEASTILSKYGRRIRKEHHIRKGQTNKLIKAVTIKRTKDEATKQVSSW